MSSELRPAPASIRAILLAAGIGQRLRPFTEKHPKSLLKVGDRTLIEHHLDHLSQIDEIRDMVIVVGYRAEQIRDAVSAWQARTGSDFSIRFVENPAFTKGSILSLNAVRDDLIASDTVIMDADVLYPRELMKRLVTAPFRNGFLLDDQTEPTGEEMMVCVRDGRALHIARSHQESTQSGWDLAGEGVGFFRLNKEDSSVLNRIMTELITAGIDDVEYEDALDRFMKEKEAGYVTCGDLPWTEIDFPEDVEKATLEVFPKIIAAGLTL